MRHLGNLALALLLFCGLGTAVRSESGAPTFPGWSTSVQTWDAIGMLSPASKERISTVQQALQKDHKVGLWVVLLDGQARYGGAIQSIEDFARSLVGQKIRGLAGNEDFILLLVCKDDRHSRIELGSNWNNEWNEGCDLITQEALVANFKRGEFDKGVVEAVEALNEMVAAKDDPSPLNQVSRLSTKWGAQLGSYSYLPAGLVVPIAIGGLCLLLLGLAVSSQRNTLAGGGMIIILLAIFSKALLWVLGAVCVIYILTQNDWGGGSRYSSWSSDSSSGFFDSSSSSSSFFDSSSSSSSSWGSSDSSWGSGGGSTGSW